MYTTTSRETVLSIIRHIRTKRCSEDLPFETHLLNTLLMVYLMMHQKPS